MEGSVASVSDLPSCSRIERSMNSAGTADNQDCILLVTESAENKYKRNLKFWELIRSCAQQTVAVRSYTYRNQQYFIINNMSVSCKALTNLMKPSDSGASCYYDVNSVVQLCSFIKSYSYQMYLTAIMSKSSQPDAVIESVFEQLKPYLLSETPKAQPTAIDPSGPVPQMKVFSHPVIKSGVENSSAVSATGAIPGTVHEDTNDTEEEFYSKPHYMEFFINWLTQTNMKCIKTVKVIKPTPKQKVALKSSGESCFHVFMEISGLPATHFFGNGFGWNQKRASWAASKSIVKRLYHYGFVTPILYHAIGKTCTVELKPKLKRWRRMKEWKTVRNAVQMFKNELTKRMPHWVQLTKSGLDSEEFIKITDEALCAVRLNVRTYDSEPNGLMRRKRKSDDDSGAESPEVKKNKIVIDRKEEETNSRRNDETSSPLNMPSVSAISSSNSEINSVKKQSSRLRSNVIDNSIRLNTVSKNDGMTLKNRKGLHDNDSDDCIILESVQTKRLSSPQDFLSDNKLFANIAYYEEFGDNAGDVNEDEGNSSPFNSSTSSFPIHKSQLPSNLEPRYQRLTMALGVVCVEEALAVRSFIKKKRAEFPNEFKLFDEHIWKHFQINGQDDRTFSWKMGVRQRLLSLIRQVYKDANLVAVGSTVNGCGSYNSDMDLCLCQPAEDHGFRNNRSYSLHVLKKLYRKFVTDWRDVTRCCRFINAKVPIIKLEMAAPNEELEIDINCNNIAGIFNSHLLHYYSRIDDRFPALCLLVKHWAINAHINNPMMGTLNSYSLILMVLHFLQCATMPPVLPNLQYLYPDTFNLTCHIESLELFRDLPYPLPPREINRDSIGELLIAFFDYYSNFDFKNNAISISSGRIFRRNPLEGINMHFKIFIEEPYDRKNTARCVTKYDNLQQIKEAFISARNAFLQVGAGPPNLRCIDVE